MSRNIFEGSLSYEGKVTLTLKSNNRVLMSRTYKNSGTTQLFRFLGYCLIGHYADVEHLLPTKIALLYNDANTPAEAKPYNIVPRSDFKGMTQTPSVIISEGTEEAKVTYSFEIPKSAITGDFNQVALYGAGCSDIYSDDIVNFSAYYYLADISKNEFNTQDIDLWSDTTVLLIDWELSLSNKNIETNNN